MRNTYDTQLLFELSQPNRRAARFPACDVPVRPAEELLPSSAVTSIPPALPELSEPEVVRHFVNLSTRNMSVDTHYYPLGSCTMKYNPKRNERGAALPGFLHLHPLQPDATIQGMLRMLYELQGYLSEIGGLSACSLQPAAGAHGELTALLVAAAYFRDRQEHRTKVLIPDNAHGTNPASAAMSGFSAVTVQTHANGLVNMHDLAEKIDEDVAVFMMTNPNTCGVFEPEIRAIADLVHQQGGLIYLDGANMNAILGIARPGDSGADMMHYNPHKTFSGPHGGGGPGAGPICVTEQLGSYLPVPVVAREGDRFYLDYQRPKSIGRVRSFFGNTGVLVRAYAYIRTHGPDGLKQVAQNAVLNANYLLAQIKNILPVPQGDRCMHEFVATAAELKRTRNVSAMDIAKRLLDYGFHAPTVYFPLTVQEAMMIEPTETESKEMLDAFAHTLAVIVEEDPELLHHAPHTTPVSRPDEVKAARQPILAY
ncbi:MAG: aminomethyl-transferring glycine dehydrogenase subunit GcvPB [Pirellulales bacterium]|nr:aminomethyl-transferring glycine dehydrogenase subunit GcvPB [Pirellulales bacterium]